MTLKSLTKQQEQKSVLKRVFYTLSTADTTVGKPISSAGMKSMGKADMGSCALGRVRAASGNAGP